MMSSDYPYAGVRAASILKEYLQQNCPQAWDLLEPVAKHFTDRCLIYSFMHYNQEHFELLSKPPLVDCLKQAAERIEFDVSLELRNVATGQKHQTLIEHTATGIRLTHAIDKQNIDQN